MNALRRGKGMRGWVLLGLVMSLPARSQAATVAYTAGDKLARGMANTLLGILEVPRNIQLTTQEENNLLEGWTVGLGKGLGYALLRTGTGLYEVVTFPFPVPEGFRPIVRPEFVWQAEGPEMVPTASAEASS